VLPLSLIGPASFAGCFLDVSFAFHRRRPPLVDIACHQAGVQVLTLLFTHAPVPLKDKMIAVVRRHSVRLDLLTGFFSLLCFTLTDIRPFYLPCPSRRVLHLSLFSLCAGLAGDAQE
jgi:hypothetical protein